MMRHTLLVAVAVTWFATAALAKTPLTKTPPYLMVGTAAQQKHEQQLRSEAQKWIALCQESEKRNYPQQRAACLKAEPAMLAWVQARDAYARLTEKVPADLKFAPGVVEAACQASRNQNWRHDALEALRKNNKSMSDLGADWNSDPSNVNLPSIALGWGLDKLNPRVFDVKPCGQVD